MDSGRRLTSRDIAALSGVSQTTVSRVLRDDPYVKVETRAKVARVLEETGYVPNAAAQSMRTRSAGTFGVVVARVTNPFYPELVDACSDAVRRQGKLMTLWIAEDDGELAALDSVRRGSVDGVIYTTATVTSASRSLCTSLGKWAPLVMVNRTVERVASDKVSSDNHGGGVAAARYLLSIGHVRVGLLGGPLDTSTALEREAGFRSALAAAGQPLNEDLCVRGDFAHAAGHEAVRALLDRDDPPTAVFCANDVIAFGALDGARALGVSVPDDLSIVGFDDVEMASWEAYSLTTVRQHLGEMARVGVEYLVQRIDGNAPKRHRHTRLPAELVIRGSTRPR